MIPQPVLPNLPDLNLPRCPWCLGDTAYMHYHDHEWGVQATDDRILFEFLLLEGAQAGLSWITILRKREAYRAAFDQFEVEKIAGYSEGKVIELMNNPGIIRNLGKIRSSITNAQAFIRIQEEFESFHAYTMRYFSNQKPLVNSWEKPTDVPAQSEQSVAISKDMKKRGFTYFGPVICYAHLQATGAVNDHLVSCFLGPIHTR